MSNGQGGGGGNGGVYAILIIIVILILAAVLYMSGAFGGGEDATDINADVNIENPVGDGGGGGGVAGAAPVFWNLPVFFVEWSQPYVAREAPMVRSQR